MRGPHSPSSGSTSRSAGKSQPRESRPNRDFHRGREARPASQTGDSRNEDIDLTGFSETKRELGQKLANAGIWPRVIPELLVGHSAERIEANFELFRERAPSIDNQGAWLRSAIQQGYALPSSVSSGEEPRATGVNANEDCSDPSSPPVPDPGTKVSEAHKQQLIEEGRATEDDFEKFADYEDPEALQHFFRIEKTRRAVADER